MAKTPSRGKTQSHQRTSAPDVVENKRVGYISAPPLPAFITPPSLAIPPLHAACAQGDIVSVQHLANEHSINMQDPWGNTPLHVAASTGNQAIIVELLSRGADPLILNGSQMSAIQTALAYGQVEVMHIFTEHLSAKGLNILYVPIHMACYEGNIDAVRVFIQQGEMLRSDHTGQTALHIACRFGHTQIVNLLLEMGMDPNIPDTANNTPLHDLANSTNCSEEIKIAIATLLLSKANINATNAYGITPLHFACQMSDLKLVAFLITKGADVNLCDKEGLSPLHIAALRGQLEVVKALITAEANLKATAIIAHQEWTALSYAHSSGHQDIVNYLLKTACDKNDGSLQILLKNRPPLSAEAINSLLELACSKQDFAMVKTIAESFNADLSAAPGSPSLLAFICASGNLENVRYLLAKGTDITPILRDASQLPKIAAAHEQGYLIINCLIQTACNKAIDLTLLHHAVAALPKEALSEDSWNEIIRKACRAETRNFVKFLIEERGFTTSAIRAIAIELSDEVAAYFNEAQDDQYSEVNQHFLVACASGKIDAIKKLFAGKNKPKVAAKNEHGDTALHIAAHQNNLTLVEWLLKNNANVNATNNDDDTALHLATKAGNIKLVTVLLGRKGININTQNNHQETALYIACKLQKTDLAKLLIDNNSNVEQADSEGNTPLHFLCNQKHEALARALMSKGAQVDASNAQGVTPLHQACNAGNTGLVKYMIQQKPAAAHNLTNDGSSLLHLACMNGNLKLVQYLVNEIGLDIASQNNDSKKAIDLAHKSDVQEYLQKVIDLHEKAAEGNLAEVQKLVESAPIISSYANGKTALHSACEAGELETARYLLSVDPGPNRLSSLSAGASTMLHYAVSSGNLELIKLITNKTNINIQNGAGDTALHIAVRNGNLDLIKFLISQQASISQPNYTNLTPLVIAYDANNIDIAKYFLINGASFDEIATCRDTRTEAAAGLQEFARICQEIRTHAHETSQSFFHAACSFSTRVEVVKALLMHDPDLLNKVGDNGNTPIHIAASSGSLEILRYLISQGADMNIESSLGLTLLHVAAYSNQLPILQLLIEEYGVAVTSTIKNGATCLHIACAAGNIDIVHYLWANFPELHTIRDSNGNAPLHIAVTNNKLDIVKYLIEEGNADLSIRMPTGDSLLHLACKYARSDIALYLSKKEEGFRVSLNNEEHTPLHYAAENDPLLFTALLPESPESKWDIAYHLIASGEIKALSLLLKSGDLAAYSLTMLCRAIIENQLEITKLLLSQEETINSDWAADLYGLAITDQKNDILQLLLETIPLDASTDLGASLLHNACASKNWFAAHNIIEFSTRLPSDANLQNAISFCKMHAALGIKGANDTAEYLGNFIITRKTQPLPQSRLEIEYNIILAMAREQSNYKAMQFHLTKHRDSISLHIVRELLTPACHSADVEMVKLLVDAFPNTLTISPSPLFEACQVHTRSSEIEAERLNLVQYLVEAKHLKCDVRTAHGKTPFDAACRFGKMPIIQYMMPKVEHSRTPDVKISALYAACLGGHLEVVRYLVDEYNTPYDNALTVDAACESIYTSFSITNSNSVKLTYPLQVACAHGNLELVSYLVKKGAKIHTIGVPTSRSPLHIAADLGKWEIANYLLDEYKKIPVTGIQNTNLKNEIIAYIASYIGRLDILKELPILPGAVLGHSLRYACKNAHFDIIKYLIGERGVNIASPLGDDGRTALMIASSIACEQITGAMKRMHKVEDMIARCNTQIEIIKYLVARCPEDKCFEYLNRTTTTHFNAVAAIFSSSWQEINQAVEGNRSLNDSAKASLLSAVANALTETIKYLYPLGLNIEVSRNGVYLIEDLLSDEQIPDIREYFNTKYILLEALDRGDATELFTTHPPINYALHHNSIKLLKILLDRYNIPIDFGNMIFACINSNLDMIKYLIQERGILESISDGAYYHLLAAASLVAKDEILAGYHGRTTIFYHLFEMRSFDVPNVNQVRKAIQHLLQDEQFAGKYAFNYLVNTFLGSLTVINDQNTLHHACDKEHFDAATYLIKRDNSKINEKISFTQETALHIAAKKLTKLLETPHERYDFSLITKWLTLIELFILNNADLDHKDRDNISCSAMLQKISHHGLTAEINLCRKISEKAKTNQLSIMHYIATLDDIALVKLVLRVVNKVDEADSYGHTPLHVACSMGRAATAALLLEKGAKINAVSHAGNTALHYAAIIEEPNIRNQIIALLKKHNADTTIENHNGFTADDLAIELPHSAEDWEMINKRYGEDVTLSLVDPTPISYIPQVQVMLPLSEDKIDDLNFIHQADPIPIPALGNMLEYHS